MNIRLLDRSSIQHQRPPAAADVIDGEEAAPRALCCGACRHPVTRDSERLAMHGAHEHRCTNPAGYTFDIGCFREAPGCAVQGRSLSAHTWFPGYRWQLALCDACGNHLGWRFTGPGVFYGLILAELVECGNGGE